MRHDHSGFMGQVKRVGQSAVRIAHGSLVFFLARSRLEVGSCSVGMVGVALASGAHEWFRYSHVFGVVDCLELLFDLMMENVGVGELWHSAISIALACVVFSVRSWIASEGWLLGGRRMSVSEVAVV